MCTTIMMQCRSNMPHIWKIKSLYQRKRHSQHKTIRCSHQLSNQHLCTVNIRIGHKKFGAHTLFQIFRFHTEMVTPNGSRCSAKQNFYFTTAFCILYGHSKGMRSVEEKSTNTNAVRALTFKKKPRPWIYNITPLSFTARWCRH